MRRYYAPFNGLRFVLNTSTGEIHDLDNETPQCQIDEIKPENVKSYKTYDQILLDQAFGLVKNINGCHHCNPSKDNG